MDLQPIPIRLPLPDWQRESDDRGNARAWASEPHRMIDYNRIDLDLTYELFQRVLRGEPLFLGDATVVLDPPGPATLSP